ncbi:MAG TPA: response regulator transcription factor [Burkholderiales bacterium]|nr:response regulator transcription factor [Burkholderiales bacterium]
MTGEPLRVMIVDDHTLVRAGIRMLLSAIANVEVVAEASDGSEAVAGIAKYRPDVVLMDLSMKDVGGLEATTRIKAEHPDTRILILSMHANEEYVLQALRAGASGYLLKEAATAELEIALGAVSSGETYLSPPVSRAVVDGYISRTAGEPGAEDGLTPRQRQILQLIAQGLGTKEIAYKLDVSVKTVETHRAMLMERLDIRDVAGLTRYAIRQGLISADD